MDTVIVKEINDKTMEHMGKIIKNGGIVAFPTETVYGLGANAYDDIAVKKIYEAKGRPSDNPLIVHLAERDDILKVAREIPDMAYKILDKFSPGPFTLILKKQPHISDTVTAGLDTVGVRIPSDEIARKFIKAAGVPVAAPSANISGKPSPTRSKHVIHDMDGRVDAIICGSDSSVGVESTIIDVTGDVPTILRPGGITPEDIISVCGDVRIDRGVLESLGRDERPKCPGMKYKHYSPDAEVVIVEGSEEKSKNKIIGLVKSMKNSEKSVGVLAMSEVDFGADKYIFAGENNVEFASVLFDALRQFDEDKMDVVFVQLCCMDEFSLALKNRLYKSAGYNIISCE